MSFPTGTLTDGQIATANGIIYTYSTSTTAWTRVNSYLPRNLTTSTAPITAGVGDIWYNTNNDKLYRYTSDGVTNAWLDFTGPAVGNAVNGSNVGASLIPANDGVYDLGSATNRFRTLYVTSSTIDIGGISLSASGGSLAVGGVALATTASVAASVAVGGGPKISSIQLTTGSSYTVTTATAISTSGGYILINGTGFVATPQVTIGAQLATSIGFVSATQLQVQVPAQVNGTYPVYVTNPDGGVAINVPGLTYNQSPVWATGSTLTPGANGTAISIQLSATDDGSVTYVVSSGSSLPSGLSLSSSGLLSGTVTGLSVETTYNFSIDAIDSYTQKVTRAFSITITVGDSYFPYVSLLLNGDGVNNSTNNTFIDSSSNNFTITRTGTPTQGSLNPFGSVWSNYFNGSSYLTMSNNSAFAFGTGDFTMEFWFSTTALGLSQKLVTFYPVGSLSGYNAIYINSNNNILYGANGSDQITSNQTITTNVWYHLAAVRQSGITKLYLNGNQVGSNYTDSTSYLTSRPAIGTDGYSLNTNNYYGYISNLLIVKGTALYTATFTPSTTPLTAVTNTVLLTCATNRFRDISTVSNAITVTGSPSVQRFNPFGNNSSSYSTSTNGGSMYFIDSSNVLTNSTTAFNLGTNPFCIEMWFYWTGGASSGYSGLCGSASDYKIALSIWNSKIMYGASSTGNSWNILAAESSVGSNTIIPNQWNHFVLCRTGNTFSGFLNGERDLTTTSSAGIISRTEGYTVGAWFSTLYYFSGYISNFRFIVGSNPYDATGVTITVPTAPLTAVTSTSLLLLGTNAGIYDGAMQNNLTTVGDAKISTTQSKFGGSSMYFDGTGDYLKSVPSAGNILRAGDFTIEFWLYPSDTDSAYRALVSSENYSSTTGGWSLYQYGTSIEFWLSSVYPATLTASSAITASTWQHLALCRASGTLRLFINGTSVASVSNSTELTGQEIWIGDNNSGSYFYNGYIDDLRITKGYARYTTTFTPPTSALLGQ